ncbi:aminopeptidase P family protein [Aliikangiella marina]|uniref:Aminopeptidase P family protein n=1 Tax=Aliikangiella marina TaxID=1712262 RepID=A0A545TJG8_9GAMM|nr:M24 family metallopeptidase [Aliikangiella marina]TQV77316.1 aminopeptidase P family protein [Aliikangiella marina]
MFLRLTSLLVTGLFLVACNPSSAQKKVEDSADASQPIHQPTNAKLKAKLSQNPWPEIRKKRIAQLLPLAMQRANIDAWLTLCRENNNDPIAEHIGGENAGSTAAYLFYRDANGFHSVVFSPVGEATALADLKIHDKVVSVPRGDSAITLMADFVKQQGFKNIAINSSFNNAQADGLSHSQRQTLTTALGEALASKLVSSEELIYQWLAIKLPEEVEIMRLAAKLTAQWQIEAYQQVIPGQSTDADIAKFLKDKMAEYGVTDAWAPDQNPNVNSGPDRGHSHATNKIINSGDVIQIDFGIKLYDKWVSDIQRFAYVLHPNQTKAPEDIQYYWTSARNGSSAAFKAMQPGVRGIDVDAAQRKLMKQAGSEYVMWSTGHPVGYVAHDTGPNLGGSQAAEVRPASKRKLQTGMVFAFDGFHAWKRPDGTLKTISVEEMAVITEDGAEYLIPPQQELILIKSN